LIFLSDFLLLEVSINPIIFYDLISFMTFLINTSLTSVNNFLWRDLY